MDSTRTLNSKLDPHLVCDACEISYPITEKSIYLTRWTGQLNINNHSLVGFEHGSVVASICWECVENTNLPSTVNCYQPPLLIREHVSIVKYMLLSKKRNRLNPSAKSPPFCMNCHMSITEGSLCVYSRLTTEHDVDNSIKRERLDEQNAGSVLSHEVVDTVRFFSRALFLRSNDSKKKLFFRYDSKIKNTVCKHLSSNKMISTH